MRVAPPNVVTLLNSGLPFVYADCFTITLRSGLKLRYTNSQESLTFIPTGEINPAVFRSTQVLMEGIRFNSTQGLEADEQECRVTVYPNVLLNDQPFLTAVRQGALDWATITRERVYMYDWGQPIQGGIILFVGRVAQIDPGGDTRFSMKVKAETVVLEESMPRNYWQMECKHTLFDEGCTLLKNFYAVSGLVEAGGNRLTINWAGATADYFDLGTITVESGPNIGAKRTIRKSNGSSLILVTPFEYDFLVGDNFKAYPGCDLARDTCRVKFNNEANFRGFPYVPTPEVAY